MFDWVRKFVFIHVPKTAGSTISHALLTSLVGRTTSGAFASLPTNVQSAYGLTANLKHATAPQLKEHLENQWEEFYKFAFIRDPFDRTISAYHWVRTKSREFSRITFNQYVDIIQQYYDDTNHPLSVMIKPQCSFFTDKNRNIMVDDLYSYEQLDIAIKNIGTRLGLELIPKSHKVTTDRKATDMYYTSATRSIITDRYAQDFEVWEHIR
ncbi:sulfotransferase family 2 domain-containing protein [Neptunomonas sp.]|uniref:sulfotransferase family 2 domain-containing protein n=1 Tax=Neptunomonas sp. TaxID=1971898 RepID=UPI0035625A54